MSLNQIHKNNPLSGKVPVNFQNISINGDALSNTKFVNNIDIDYDETKANTQYLYAEGEGNSSVYGYVDEFYTVERNDDDSYYTGTVLAVSDQGSFINAVLVSQDTDVIVVTHNIQFVGQQNIVINKNIKLAGFTDSVSITFSDNTFNNITFSAEKIFIEKLEFIAPDTQQGAYSSPITFDNTCVDVVILKCVFVTKRQAFQIASTNLRLYDTSFIPYGLTSSISNYYVEIRRLIGVYDIKNCHFYGYNFSVEPDNKSAIFVNPIISTDSTGELFIEDCAFGNPSYEIDNGVKMFDNIQDLKIYVHNNSFNVSSSVVNCTNSSFFDGVSRIQLYNNTITKKTLYESQFKGACYGDGVPIILADTLTLKTINAYKNVISPLDENSTAIVVPSSTKDNPLLTSGTLGNVLFIRKINPLFINLVSYDSDPSGVGLVNPLNDDIDANNKKILGVNEISTANLKATGSQITITSNIISSLNTALNTVSSSGDGIIHFNAQADFGSTYDITNIRIMSVGDIEPLTIGGDVSINANLEMNMNNIESISTIKASEIHVNSIDTTSAEQTEITLRNNLVPNTALINLGGPDSSEKFNYIYASNTQSDSVFTNELNAITGGIISNNSISPNNNNTKDLGSSANMWRDIYATRLRTDFLDGKTNPTITLQGNLTPDNSNSRTLGQTDKVYQNIYTRQLGSDATLMIRPNNLDANRVQFADTYVRPYTDNQKSLGLSGNRWTTIYAVNGSISTSSRTKKRNIMDCKMGLDFIDKLEPKMYIYLEDPDDQPMRCGLIYEDVEEVINTMPNISFAGLHRSEYDDADPDTGEVKHVVNYGIDYSSFVAPLIGSVKELKKQNEDLLKRLETLEAKMN